MNKKKKKKKKKNKTSNITIYDISTELFITSYG